MPQVLQAKCPGCNKVLRIPADWVNQTVRCKHCGMIVQAKSKPAPAKATEPVAPIPQDAAPRDDRLSFSANDATPIIRVPRLRRRSRGTKLLISFIYLLLLVLTVGGGYYAWPRLTRLGADLGGDLDQSVRQRTIREEPNPTETSLSNDASFPRRALVICVNNYLYANPVSYGTPDKNVHVLMTRLSRVLHIPQTQIGELSDATAPPSVSPPAAGGRYRGGAPAKSGKQPSATESPPIAPIRPAMEKTISQFLKTSRPQDRILLFFLGHVVVIDDDAYLVPLEGELTSKEKLIPLKWLYDRLKECKARQRVLILDTCRLDSGRGLERPGSGPMAAKLDALLAKPPEGVQVWTACVAGQYSYELDGTSVFLNKLFDALQQKLSKKIQHEQDSIPIEALAELVNKSTASEVDDQLRAKQTPRLSGRETAAGVTYDKDDPPPPKFEIPATPLPPGGMAKTSEVQSILNEIDLPPIKLSKEETAPIRIDALVPFSTKVLEGYRADYASPDYLAANPDKYPLRAAVLDAVKLLDKVFNPKSPAFTLMDYFAGGNNDTIKKEIEQKQRGPARVEAELQTALTELEQVRKESGKDPSKRWQAHYDYVHAQLLARLAYVKEYNLMLGKIRKDELPVPETGVPVGGWRLASREKLTTKECRDMAAQAKKIFAKLAEEHAGTPWEVLAKRAGLTALGLEWQPNR